ncbi:MAG: succinyl-CoA synthetase beta subunit [Alphaproteobacteria bacterium]|jgi:succinyl-CoA synthetase beta subunit
MNIHEHQAKALLKQYGLPVSKGHVVYTRQEAETAAEQLGGPVYVVKAQIHAGGRGKGGGVKVVKSVKDVGDKFDDIFGMQLITHQTGPEGKLVKRVYIEDGTDIESELYLSVVVDRATSRVSFVVSTEGGMDIEEVAENTPEKIISFSVDPATGISAFHGRKVADALELKGAAYKQCIDVVQKIYTCFVETDADMLEINPLVVNTDGNLVCLDAKMGFDGNALYRQPKIVEMRDFSEEDPMEIEASKWDLSFVKLDGNIGCMVNGAGLAMATMDIIKYYGSEPANFLDVGGGATKEKVTEAFKIILNDPSVEGILVNIFGGIMRCDIIADGVICAVRELGLTIPLVVRLEGTNVDLGKKMMAESGLSIIPADNLADAAEKVVAAVKNIHKAA